ncbi:MAG: hypothetical protein ACYCOU_01950 [Sulfobacillus sp.]
MVKEIQFGAGTKDTYSAELYNHVLMNRLILDGELSPENFVLPLDAFTCNDTAYIVMEGIRGETLVNYLHERESMSALQFVRLLARLAEITGQLARLRISHNDLHLANVIMRPDGDPVIIDYGRIKREDDIFDSERRYVPGFDNFMLISRLVFELIAGKIGSSELPDELNEKLEESFASPWQDNVRDIDSSPGIRQVLEFLAKRLPAIGIDNSTDFSLASEEGMFGPIEFPPKVYADLAKYGSNNLLKLLRSFEAGRV